MYQKSTDTGKAAKLPIRQDAWMMFRFDNHEVIRLDLEPGDAMENHTNEWRIVFYVVAGEGTLNITSTDHILVTGQAIAVKPGLERFWKNSGTEKLELLVIKTEGEG